MKKALPLLFFLFLPFLSSAQFGAYDISFDSNSQLWRVQIDSGSSWQIGPPQKTTFSSAYSPPNVIVTDTLNPPPVNDTSSFIVKHVADLGLLIGHTVILAGQYFVDSDSLTDYGKIEFSPDNGTTWVNLINNPNCFGSFPTLTGRSPGWSYFSISLEQLGPMYNVQMGDTVLYRFTFMTDSVQTNRDGLMYDDLHLEDWAEGIAEYGDASALSIFPDPAEQVASISFAGKSLSVVTIYNSCGEVVEKTEHDFSAGPFLLRREQLPAGIYFAEIANDEKIYRTKFVFK